MRAALLVAISLAACGEPRSVALSRWRGTPLVVTAVYTACVDTCPRWIVASDASDAATTAFRVAA